MTALLTVFLSFFAAPSCFFLAGGYGSSSLSEITITEHNANISRQLIIIIIIIIISSSVTVNEGTIFGLINYLFICYYH